MSYVTKGSTAPAVVDLVTQHLPAATVGTSDGTELAFKLLETQFQQLYCPADRVTLPQTGASDYATCFCAC